MSRRKQLAGSTGVMIPLFVLDSTSTAGAGLSGLVYNTSGLVAKYRREGQSSWTTVTLATATVGIHTSGGFVADGGLSGGYEFGAPDAAVAAGARWVNFIFSGAANMVPTMVEIELDTLNYQAANGNLPVDLQTIKTQSVTCAGGVTIPAATLASTTNITAGTVTTVSGNVNGNVSGNVSGSVGSVAGAVGSVTGAVGSVIGNVGGNVVGSTGSVTGAVGSVTGSIGGDVQGKVLGGGAGTITGDGVRASSVTGAVGSVTGAVGSVTGSVGSVVGAVGSVTSGVTIAGTLTSLDAIWNKIKAWLGLLAGKTADLVTLAEIQTTNAGASYNNTTDSLEAVRDRGDAAWTTGSGGGGGETIIVAPLSSVQPTSIVRSSGTTEAFQFTPLPAGPIAISDANGPIDLSGDDLKLIAVKTDTPDTSFTLTTDDSELSIGGDDNNQVSIDYVPTLSGKFKWHLYRAVSVDRWQVIAWGFFNILDCPDPNA